MPVTADSPAPYASPSTIIGLIKRYRDRGLQTPFSGEILERVGVGPSLISRTLAALETLDFIDSQGNPTAGLEALGTAPEVEYKEHLAQMVRSAYEDVFRFVDPAEDSPSKIQDAFRSYTPRGQMSRMVTLFLGLCHEAGIIDELPKRPGRKPGTKVKAKARKKPQGKPLEEAPNSANSGGGPNLFGPLAFEQGGGKPGAPSREKKESVQFKLPVPRKADCVLSLPSDIDGDDWEMLKIQLDAYVSRLVKEKGEQ